ncbi:hypothetical protein ABZ802_17600 [Streptomyces sp. NPDC047737]|uniref:hypothetical protein n=1 Tax=Streptomyces sp. NPDC047737 TaxID=3155740 RepID=UPI0033F8B40C
MVTLSAPNAQDCVALAEIELCGELMIAAADAIEDRLSPDRIDEVLNVRADALDATDGLCEVGADALDARDGLFEVGADALGVRDGLFEVGADALGVRTDAGEPAPTIPRQARHRG